MDEIPFTQEIAERQREIIASLDLRSGLEFRISFEEGAGCNLSLHCPPTETNLTEQMCVTARATKTVEGMLPGITNRLRQEKGKIVFIGNGLSDLPLIAAGEVQKGSANAKPIMVDIFDYFLIQEDLEKVREALEGDKLPLPHNLELFLGRASKLRGAIEAGRLDYTVYMFGTGNVPGKLLDTSLAVNVVGPGVLTLVEQAQILAPGGKLYTSGVFTSELTAQNEIGTDFEVEEISEENHSFLIKRIR